MGIDIHLTIAVRRRESAHRATGDLVWSGENLEPETTEALAEVRRRLVEDGGPDVNEALDSLARVGAAVIENALKRTSRVIPDWEIVLECESDAGDRWRLHAWRGRVETVGYVWPDVTAFNREEER